ncbi:MAG: CoA transferase [Dehalococcoidales bacterium]|nr:CoA transferase [Dehalococcoidales bacterium]
MNTKQQGLLSPYRVLDLTDEKGLLCGKLLGDLGADIIKIEPPGGDPSRNIGPFYHDEPHPEKSLFWFARNANKRGITLDIEKAEGKELFTSLVKTADFVIESFPPGYLESLGLGYKDLEKINPRLIMVSITPFGQAGPHKDFKAADIVLWGMGGAMNLWRDNDRATLHASNHSQAYLQGAAEGASAAVMALYYRRMTGQGQQLDISIQECVARCSCPGDRNSMMLLGRKETGVRRRAVWPCKDGCIVWMYAGGPLFNLSGPQFLRWMDEEGQLNDFLRTFDWMNFDFTLTTKEVIDKMEESTMGFLMSHTKAELFEGAIKRRVMLYPVNDAADIMASKQLAFRDFWVKVEHPELGTSITYPGAFAKFSELPARIYRRAPLIGEHNKEIYEQEFGITGETLTQLKQAGVI